MRVFLGGACLAVGCALCRAAATTPTGQVPPADATLHAPVVLAVGQGLAALEAHDALSARAALWPIAQQARPPADAPWPDSAWIGRFATAQASFALHDPEATLACLEGLDAPLAAIGDHLWLLRAQALAELQRWPEAQRGYNAVLAATPSRALRADATFGLADLARATGATGRAGRLYAAALRAWPHHAHADVARLHLAQAAADAGHTAAAIDQLQRLVDQSTGDTAAQAAQQLAVVRRGPHLGPAVSLAQELAHVDRLVAVRALPEAQAALAQLTAPISSASDAERIDERRGQIALRSRDYGRAIAIFKRLVQGNTARAKQAYQRPLAAALAAAGRTQEALATLDDVGKNAPARRDIMEARFRAAWIAYEAGLHAEAVARLEAYLRAYPGAPNLADAIWLSAWNAYHAGDWPHALARLTALARRTPSGAWVAQAQFWRGCILAQMGENAAAGAAWAQVAAGGPSYYAWLARGRLRQGSLHTLSAMSGPTASEQPRQAAPPALAALTPALAWHDDALAWDSPAGVRAMRLMQLGLLRQAADAVPTLPARSPSERTAATFGRARLLLALGDYAGALRHLPQGAPARQVALLAYPEAHPSPVAAAAREFAISPYLLLAVMRQESAYDEGAHSSASAHGLMQIIPRTGRRIAQALHHTAYQDSDLKDPGVSIRFGAWYLAQLLAKYDGHVAVAVGAYNAGPAAMDAWLRAHPGASSDAFIEDITFKETRSYVKHVLTNLSQYEARYRQDAAILRSELPLAQNGGIDF